MKRSHVNCSNENINNGATRKWHCRDVILKLQSKSEKNYEQQHVVITTRVLIKKAMASWCWRFVSVQLLFWKKMFLRGVGSFQWFYHHFSCQVFFKLFSSCFSSVNKEIPNDFWSYFLSSKSIFYFKSIWHFSIEGSSVWSLFHDACSNSLTVSEFIMIICLPFLRHVTITQIMQTWILVEVHTQRVEIMMRWRVKSWNIVYKISSLKLSLLQVHMRLFLHLHLSHRLNSSWS